jgi:lysophospholipase L1-like esterase
MKKYLVPAGAVLVLLLAVDLMVGGAFFALKHIGGGRSYYKFFDYRDAYFRLARDNRNSFAAFSEDFHDPAIGWNNPRSGHLAGQDCVGAWEASYNADGSRASCHPGAGEKYAVVCVGDSFTHGNEADDCSSYPAALQRLLGVNVGNFGVGGFDAIQSVMQYEAVLSRLAAPRIGILGIMYENGRRNLNSFRPVYTNEFDPYEAFLFKPYFDGARVVNPVLPDKATFESYLRLADARFSADFWAKPELTFPFTLSLIQSLRSRNFEFLFMQKLNRLLGRGMYAHDYRTPAVLDGLRLCAGRFIAASAARGVFPVIVFLPSNTQDLTSPNALVAELQTRYPGALVLNFGEYPMDWSRYVVAEGCHPTAAGYAAIAAFIKDRIAAAKLLP